MRYFQLLLFSFASGLTVSGLVANLYRILARKPRSRAERLCQYTVMALAGPSVLLDNSTRSFHAKHCSAAAYGFAVAVSGYWAVLIGAVILELIL
jgi:hypothetical protein